MTHPLFRKEMFVETAFAKRLQKMLQHSWDNCSWHLLVADPGAGKTMSIRDLQKRAGGGSVLAVVAPKNNDDEQALGDQLLAALGLPIRGYWSTRKPKLMGHLHQYGVPSVECPRCGRTRSISPVKGVLRFPPHDRRKTQTDARGKRWSTAGKTDWDVVGGETNASSIAH